MQDKLHQAKEARAAAFAKVEALGAKIDAGTWVAATDGPALKEAQEELRLAKEHEDNIQGIINTRAMATSWNPTTTTDQPITVNVIKNVGDDKEKVKREFRILEAGRDVVKGGRLTGMAAELDQEGKREAAQSGIKDAGGGHFTMPGWLAQTTEGRSIERRDITATTTTTGGYTIATELGGLIPLLDPRLTVRQMGATYLPGLTSNVDFPRNDAGATAVWASAENTTSTETTPTFDKISMSPKRITAFTDVSQQNLLQTSIAMENFVRERLARSRDNLLETACISGTGSSGQPTGLLTVSGTNDITIGTNGGPLTWALTVQFETETATDNADMGTLGYLFTPGVAGVLKTTKRDVAGNGFIWEGPNMGATVNGYRAMATNFLPSTLTKGSSSGVCHAAIFGNWSELIIGQWGGLDMIFNPYTKGKEALIEVIMHSWYDLAVRHALSFCKCDEITLS